MDILPSTHNDFTTGCKVVRGEDEVACLVHLSLSPAYPADNIKLVSDIGRRVLRSASKFQQDMNNFIHLER